MMFSILLNQETNAHGSKMCTFASPLSLLLITILYVTFVKLIAPNIIKKRQAFATTGEMILKTVLFGINLYVFYNLLMFSWIKINDDYGQSTEITTLESFNMPQIFMLYFTGKVLELLETVFCVLNMESNKVTNIHVLHRSSAMSFVWMTLMFTPNCVALLFALVNTFIQLTVYSQYLFGSYMNTKYLKQYYSVLEEMQFISLIAQAYLLIIVNSMIPKLFILGVFSMFIVNFIAFYIDPENKKNKEFKKTFKHMDIGLEDIVQANSAQMY